ncbi:MAG: hypothetical protein DRQ13_12185 [Ignavibacteriae bacterium]|nr:MAG: hypothetical protein DRQ13_12185 [Ignavibacteriota bacterium]
MNNQIIRGNIMHDISQIYRGNVVTNRVNVLRATINEASVLRNLLEEQIVLEFSKIVIDLSQCTHLDSTFLGVLVVTQKELMANGVELKLVEPLDSTKVLLSLSGISKVFNTYETSDDALRSFMDNVEPKETVPEYENNDGNIEWAFGR